MLTERKKKILQIVVGEFVNSNEPIGSRTVARRFPVGLSSATIRNEMADLEEMGFLEQPHTSAGRVPSHKGYRYYVDHLMEDIPLSKEEQKKIADSFSKFKEIEKVILAASNLLSQITDYTSLILGPQFRKSAFYQLRILPLNKSEGLVVLLTRMGFVKNKIIELPRSLSARELQQVVNYLNRKLYNLTIDQVTQSLINELKRDLFNRMEILEQAFMLLEESLREEKEDKIFLGGTTNILNQPEFKDVEKIKNFLHLFEQDALLTMLLNSHSGDDEIVVRIGSENQIEQVRECTLVTSTFMIDKRTMGKVGILGPTRMDYPRVVGVIKCIVENLNQVFNDW